MRRQAKKFCQLVGVACVLVFLSGLGGCTPSQYAEQADRDAYKALSSGREFAIGREDSFYVTYDPFRCEPRQEYEEILIGSKPIPLDTGEPVALTLSECLEIAFRNSRSFQSRKELLYSLALELANSRRSWSYPLLAGDLAGFAEHEKINRDGETNTGEVGSALSLTQRFIQGGVLTLGYGLALATDFTGWGNTTIGSLMEANFTQPLLQGAWRGLAYEQQYRLERDFILAVYDYERFTQEFAADIVTRYYRVLQQRDRLENEKANIQRLRETLALTRSQAKGGQVSRIQEDQAEQDLLNAEIRFEENRQAYENILDRFKITLGLPIGARIEGDYPGGLDALMDEGLKPIDLAEKKAIEIALTVRPDVLTERAALRDAERDVEIAADAFLPVLDLELGISAAGTEPRKFWRTRFQHHTRTASLVFDYQFDQTDNRDAYRNAMIDHERAQRDYEEFLDNVRLDVRESYRQLTQSRRSFELQRRSVAIAKRRDRLAFLQQREGQASARDVLEAGDALRQAQNGLTSALVNYTTTRLEFFAALGLLGVDEKGQLYERDAPFTFERIDRRYFFESGEE